MSVSLDEYRKRLRSSPQGEARIHELRGMAQEAPRAAALTGSAEWDWYLRYVEASIKMAERLVEGKRVQAASLVLVDEAKAKAAAVQVTALEARRDTLLELISLPKFIIENGKQAADIIAKLEAEA